MKEKKAYAINIPLKFESRDIIEKKQKNLFQLLKRLQNSDEKFKDISFVIGISNTSSLDAKVSYICRKNRGRPRKIVSGTKIMWHFHIYVIGSDISSAATFATFVRNYISKKFGYKVSISTNDCIDNALKYVSKQCLFIWKYGNYFNSKNNC